MFSVCTAIVRFQPCADHSERAPAPEHVIGRLARLARVAEADQRGVAADEAQHPLLGRAVGDQLERAVGGVEHPAARAREARQVSSASQSTATRAAGSVATAAACMKSCCACAGRLASASTRASRQSARARVGASSSRERSSRAERPQRLDLGLRDQHLPVEQQDLGRRVGAGQAHGVLEVRRGGPQRPLGERGGAGAGGDLDGERIAREAGERGVLGGQRVGAALGDDQLEGGRVAALAQRRGLSVK